MKIEIAFPPNIAEVEKLVPGIRDIKGVLFAFGDTVFNPSGVPIPAWLVAHEQVHLDRQTDPATWWHRYLTDAEFRFAEELPAHQAEWKEFKRHVKSREQRARYLLMMAQRLSGPLYGRLCSVASARAKIEGGSKVRAAMLLPQAGKA